MLAVAVKVLVARLPKAVDLMVLPAAVKAESVVTPPVTLMLPVVKLVTEVLEVNVCEDAKPTLALLLLVADRVSSLLALFALPVALKVLPLTDKLLLPMVLATAFR